MTKPQIARDPRVRILGAIFASTLVLTGATSAEAQQVQTFPGSSCQASGSAQDLYYSGVAVANRGSNTRSAVCPIVRSKPAQGWSRIRVHVRDRHSTLNVTCVAQARALDGTAAWSETKSTAGEGDQVLLFPAPGAAVPNYGPYTVICSIPPMEKVNQPSYIASYVVFEP